MYCSRCGQPIGVQPQCPNCGAINAIAGRVPLAFSRIARHLRTVGILWVAFSIYTLLQWMLVLPFLHSVFRGRMWMYGHDSWAYGPFHPGGWLLQFIGVIVLVRVLLSLAVGVALLTRQPWGRIFAIVIAVLTLMKPFVGTVLAIYTLWVLLGRNADQEYERMVISDGISER